MPYVMSSITQVLLILFLVDMFAVLLLGVVWKREDVSFSEVFWKGSFVYRDIEKYIRKDRISPFMALSYSGILLFMAVIVSAFLTWL